MIIAWSRCRRHGLLLAFLGVGFVLRLITWLAYRPALLYIDSFRYLENFSLKPDQLNPIGYDLALAPLALFGGLSFVAVVQHVLGLAIAVATYALVLRLGGRRWVGALATLPILLDGYQLQIEQNIMSEVWFEALLVVILWLCCRRGGPAWWSGALLGLLLAGGLLLRLIGITVAVPVLLYLLLGGGVLRAWRTQWRRGVLRTVAALATLCIVLVPYAAYFKSVTGYWGLTISSGNVLYGRAAAVADCGELNLDPVLREFCPPQPLDNRLGIDFYAHADVDPNWPGPLPPGADRLRLAHEFAIQVIEQQPLDVAKAVLGDFFKGFAPQRLTFSGDVPVERWQFQRTYPVFPGFPLPNPYTERFDGVEPASQPQLALFLRGYQLTVGYTPGPLIAVAGLLGIAGTLGIARARRSGLRSISGLATGSALILMLGSAAFEFSWRYQLPGLVLFPIAGAIGFTALTTRATDQSMTTGSESTP